MNATHQDLNKANKPTVYPSRDEELAKKIDRGQN